MQIDFNNLRKQTCDTYDLLAKELNDRAVPLLPGTDTRRIKRIMNDLKSYIATIACCSDEKAGFTDVLGDRELITFAEEE